MEPGVRPEVDRITEQVPRRGVAATFSPLACALTCAILAAAWLSSCATRVGGGGGSDVPNDLQGRLLLASGDPASAVRVILRRVVSSPWTPSEERSVWTDSDGRYVLPVPLGTGEWTVEWQDSLRGLGAFRSLDSLRQPDGRLEEVRLEDWGVLAGTCVSDSREVIATDRLWIPELGRVVAPDSTGSWAFPQVPSGRYAPRLLTQAQEQPFVFPASTVAPGGRRVLAPILLLDSVRGAWRGRFETPSGGAAVGVRVSWIRLPDAASRTVLARSDDSGRIILPNPDTGTWTYTFARPSGDSRTLEVRVPDTTSDRRWSLPSVVVLGGVVSLP